MNYLVITCLGSTDLQNNLNSPPAGYHLFMITTVLPISMGSGGTPFYTIIWEKTL